MMTDSIADMLTRIRNAQMARKATVEVPFSKVKFSIAQILVGQGYVESVNRSEENDLPLVVTLKYHGKNPAITELKRESTPGHRMYRKSDELPRVLNGFGTAIVSTSQGIMTVEEAKKKGIGGEVLCSVY